MAGRWRAWPRPSSAGGRGRGDAAADGEVIQDGGGVRRAELAGMGASVNARELADPVEVGFLGARGVVQAVDASAGGFAEGDGMDVALERGRNTGRGLQGVIGAAGRYVASGRWAAGGKRRKGERRRLRTTDLQGLRCRRGRGGGHMPDLQGLRCRRGCGGGHMPDLQGLRCRRSEVRRGLVNYGSAGVTLPILTYAGHRDVGPAERLDGTAWHAGWGLVRRAP
jgi:hypothetical protein